MAQVLGRELAGAILRSTALVSEGPPCRHVQMGANNAHKRVWCNLALAAAMQVGLWNACCVARTGVLSAAAVRAAGAQQRQSSASRLSARVHTRVETVVLVRRLPLAAWA